MEEKKDLDPSSDSDTEEYDEEGAQVRAMNTKKVLLEKWEKMEAEKAKLLAEKRENKKQLKRKRREEEEEKLEKFQKLDPHFNPKLKHFRKRLKKLSGSAKDQEKKPEKVEEVPEKEESKLDFAEESVQRLNRLREEAVVMIKDHLPENKSSFLKKFFDVTLPHMVQQIKKEVLSYYNMGLINYSVKAIMYMTGINAEDCKEGIESIKKFTYILECMCEIIQEELNHRKE